MGLKRKVTRRMVSSADSPGMHRKYRISILEEDLRKMVGEFDLNNHPSVYVKPSRDMKGIMKTGRVVGPMMCVDDDKGDAFVAVWWPGDTSPRIERVAHLELSKVIPVQIGSRVTKGRRWGTVTNEVSVENETYWAVNWDGHKPTLEREDALKVLKGPEDEHDFEDDQ